MNVKRLLKYVVVSLIDVAMFAEDTCARAQKHTFCRKTASRVWVSILMAYVLTTMQTHREISSLRMRVYI